MSSKPKSKAKRVSRPAGKSRGESKAANNSRAAPTAEWLAEMAIRIAGPLLRPSTKFKDQMDEYWESSRIQKAASYGLSTALEIYRKAHSLTEPRKHPGPLPPPKDLNAKEKKTGAVGFVRGIKFITGEKRRDRAEEKYIHWRERQMNERDDFDGMPELKDGFRVANLSLLKAAYETFSKKTLASQSGQKKTKSRRNSSKS